MTAGVLVFVEDPGAANGLVFIPRALRARGFACRVAAAGFARSLFPRDAEHVVHTGDDANPDAVLDFARPSALVVGTSENPRTVGLRLVDAARARGIPSIGFVDAYPNASHRFRGASTEPLAHCPDRIFVPDEWTAAAFHELGLEPERIVVTGHPHHDAVLDRRAELEREGLEACRRRVFPESAPDARIVMFAAEISTGFDPGQFQRSHDYLLAGRGGRDGRTQIVLEELIDAVRAVRGKASRPIHLILRLHPKNTLEDFGDLAREVDGVSRGGAPLDAAFASDLVAGMTTMLLVEAALLGTPTLSIVPRLVEREWLPSVRTGLTPCVSTREDLARELSTWAASGSRRLPPFTRRGALNRMVDAIVSNLEGSKG